MDEAERIKDLKYKLVKVVIRSGVGSKKEGACCQQQGYLSKVEKSLLQLVNKDDKSKIYIPLDAVIAVKIIKESSGGRVEGKRDENINLPLEVDIELLSTIIAEVLVELLADSSIDLATNLISELGVKDISDQNLSLEINEREELQSNGKEMV